MTRITTPFGFASTASDVIRGVDLTGRRALVTGGASGIGIETARALASAGADVTIAARNLDAARQAASAIAASTQNGAVHITHLDLADEASVAALADAWDGPLHILVNNAGVMMSPEAHTERGWEMQFATNHLGHFALATRLKSALVSAQGARIVAVSSSGHLWSPVVFDDVNFRFRPYDPLLAYGQSKSATILFAVEATARWSADGIYANACNPGAILTNLQRHVGGTLRTPPEYQKTVEQGAATSVLLAASPLLEGVGGRYFNDCNETQVVDHRPAGIVDIASSVAPYALDSSNASRLWELSVAAIG